MGSRQPVFGISALVLAAALSAFSTGPLLNLFEDYQDSPAWAYLLFGLPPLVFAVVAALFGVRALAPRVPRAVTGLAAAWCVAAPWLLVLILRV